VLLQDAEQISEALAESLWERVPGYEITALDRAELLDAIRASVQAMFQCLVEGRLPSQQELEPARALGERRAIQGVPIESVVGSWHNAERFFGDRLLGVGKLGASDAREMYRQLARVIDRMTEVAAAAYRDVRGEVQAQFSQASADIVSSLAGEERLDPAELERRAVLIGVEPQLPYRAIALGTRNPERIALARTKRAIVEALRSRRMGQLLAGTHRGYDLLLLTEHQDVVEVIKRAMNRIRGPEVVFAGLGEPRPRLVEGAGSLREAISAVRVALVLNRPLVRFVDVVPEVLLQESPLSARTMVEAVLGPIDHGDLVETLQGFLSSGLSVRATARRLHVHENTVSYRIKRILEAFELDSVDDLVRPDVLLALRARELFMPAE
jgi:sugar diacid utilization regulator